MMMMMTATAAPAIEVPIPGYTDHPDERGRLIKWARRAHPGRNLQVVDVTWGDGVRPTHVRLDDREQGPRMRPEPMVSEAAFSEPRGAERAEQWLRQNGRTLARWDARNREVWSMPADTYDDQLRARLAEHLGLADAPWRIRVSTSFEAEAQKRCQEVTLIHESGCPLKSGGMGLTPLLDAYGGRWTHAYNPNTRRAVWTWVDPKDKLQDFFVIDPTTAVDIDPLTVPTIILGRSETGELLTLNLDKDAAHIAMQGMTRSGKSVETYNLLSTLAASRAVDVYGVDPSGILLAPFSGTRHGDRIALGTHTPEEYLKVLEKAVAIMDARTAELGRSLSADKLEDFSPEQPLLLVVLEEMPGIMKALRSADAGAERGATKLEAAFKLLLGRLLAEGAKVGIRCLLIAQRFDTASAIDGSDRANLGVSITFRVKRNDAIGMLHEELPEGMTAQEVGRFAPGVGLLESPVTGQDIVRFRAPFIEGGFAAYARRVREYNPPVAGATPVEDMDLPAEEVDLGRVELDWDEDMFTATVSDELEEFPLDLDDLGGMDAPAAHQGTTTTTTGTANKEEMTW